MGAFVGALENVGSNILANSQNPYFRQASQGLHNRYQARKDQNNPLDQSSLASAPGGVDDATMNSLMGNPNAGPEALQGANQAAGMKDLSMPGAGASADIGPDQAAMANSQWNQPTSGGSGGGLLGGILSAAQGTLVTKPTLARIGESGPEAVIPMNNRPGNKVQPDLLEGHLANPKIPGVKYSRYKGYNRFGSAGGQV